MSDSYHRYQTYCHISLPQISYKLSYIITTNIIYTLMISYMMCMISYMICVISYMICAISYMICVISYMMFVISYMICVILYIICVISYMMCVILQLLVWSVLVLCWQKSAPPDTHIKFVRCTQDSAPTHACCILGYASF